MASGGTPSGAAAALVGGPASYVARCAGLAGDAEAEALVGLLRGMCVRRMVFDENEYGMRLPLASGTKRGTFKMIKQVPAGGPLVPLGPSPPVIWRLVHESPPLMGAAYNGLPAAVVEVCESALGGIYAVQFMHGLGCEIVYRVARRSQVFVCEHEGAEVTVTVFAVHDRVTGAPLFPGAAVEARLVAGPEQQVEAARRLGGFAQKLLPLVLLKKGWDDIGLHNPRLRTPHLDAFIKRGTLLDNYYCAPTRAALLTGRAFPATGTLMVNGGWDQMNRGEALAGEVLGAAGYTTAMFGKWHSDWTGYAPWDVGFDEAWYAPGHQPNATLIHNGQLVRVPGFGEEANLLVLLDYLRRQAAAQDGAAREGRAAAPFFAYYATRAIHMSPGVPGQLRSYPPSYLRRLMADPANTGVAQSILDAWANVEFLDDLLGRLFDFLDTSGLASSTYVLLTSDNGPDVTNGLERKEQRRVRVPSGMRGIKATGLDGGIRTFLAVAGPGVPGGVVDSTLVAAEDVLPTLVDLAGLTRDDIALRGGKPLLPWDGISAKNLLLPAAPPAAGGALPARRGVALATLAQRERAYVTLAPNCWDPDAVPRLGPDRRVVKPQPLLDYDNGGMPHYFYGNWIKHMRRPHPGFEICLAVRWRDYKWTGADGTVYKFSGQSHVEEACNAAPPAEAASAGAAMRAAARAWFARVLSSPHSFTPPTFVLGLGPRTTNAYANAAHERTPGAITLLEGGASGFRAPGDRLCLKLVVLTPGDYDVTAFYTAAQSGTFRFGVGEFGDIAAGTAPALRFTLPAQAVMAGRAVGTLTLPLTPPDAVGEACLALESSAVPLQPVFTNLSVLRFSRRARPRRASSAQAGGQAVEAAAAAAAAAAPAVDVPPARLPEASEAAPRGAADAPAGGAVRMTTAELEALRLEHRWPRGQVTGGVLEAMFSPFDVEDLHCAACQPPI
ncbi:hypothetical protein HT031_006493 [Scenedesmus sp. PABB004]|nr:hypothetical protein HT031_006493 [Scenedesmus sp. PABB004]